LCEILTSNSLSFYESEALNKLRLTNLMVWVISVRFAPTPPPLREQWVHEVKLIDSTRSVGPDKQGPLVKPTVYSKLMELIFNMVYSMGPLLKWCPLWNKMLPSLLNFFEKFFLYSQYSIDHSFDYLFIYSFINFPFIQKSTNHPDICLILLPSAPSNLYPLPQGW